MTKPRLYKGNGIWWCAYEGYGWYGGTWQKAMESFKSSIRSKAWANYHHKETA